MTAFFWTVSATCSFVALAYFLRFWRETRDLLFALFAIAFALLTVHWTLLATVASAEHAPYHYALRLVAFLLIAFAIVWKNRK
jgi:hypothetical protein